MDWTMLCYGLRRCCIGYDPVPWRHISGWNHILCLSFCVCMYECVCVDVLWHLCICWCRYACLCEWKATKEHCMSQKEIAAVRREKNIYIYLSIIRQFCVACLTLRNKKQQQQQQHRKEKVIKKKKKYFFSVNNAKFYVYFVWKYHLFFGSHYFEWIWWKFVQIDWNLLRRKSVETSNEAISSLTHTSIEQKKNHTYILNSIIQELQLTQETVIGKFSVSKIHRSFAKWMMKVENDGVLCKPHLAHCVCLCWREISIENCDSELLLDRVEYTNFPTRYRRMCIWIIN